jgi:hypothetical protein
MTLKKMKAIRPLAAATDGLLKETPINPSGLPSAEKTNGDRKKERDQRPEETQKKYCTGSNMIGREIKPWINLTESIFQILPQTRNSNQFMNTTISQN